MTKYIDSEEKDLFESLYFDKTVSLPNAKLDIAKYKKIAKKQ